MKFFLFVSWCLSLTLFASETQKPSLPEGESWSWDAEPVVATSQLRGERVLNGLWLFQPAKDAQAPTGPWGAIRVPGSWEMQAEWGNMNLPGLVGQSPAWPGVTFGDGDNGKNEHVLSLPNAWYEREISIPEAWKGRKVMVDFQRVSTDALVFLDGRKVGELHWPGGSVDLTPHVQFGAKHQLRLHITAVASEKELLIAMREDYADKGNSGLRHRGIIGDVVMTSEPAGPTLQPIAVNCSVQKSEISLTFGSDGLTAATDGTATAIIRKWPSGEEALRWESPVRLIPNETITLTQPWKDPLLWDIGQPNLYTVSLEVKAGALHDERTERFGFREIYQEGRKIFMNGRELRTRTAHANADQTGGNRENAVAHIKRHLHDGYSLLEIWPNDVFRRGFGDFRGHYAHWADEMGILLFMPLVRPDDIFKWQQEIPEPLYQKWYEANRKHVVDVRNSPSVLAYLFFGNEFMTSDDQNPLRIGNREALMQSQQKDVSKAIEMLENLRKLSPTQLFASHSGAAVGDFHTANHYLGITPIQEREETLAAWTLTGDMPFGSVEFCSPFSADLHRARSAWNTMSEALFHEHAAAQLGAESYLLETDAYRKSIVDTYDPVRKEYTAWAGGPKGYVAYQPYQIYAVDSLKRIWRSWRTYGITFGMVQWEKFIRPEVEVPGKIKCAPFVPGTRGVYYAEVPANWRDDSALDLATLLPHQRAYYDGIQPTLAYIGGSSENDAWVAKDHHFTAGQAVCQSFVLVHDGSQALNYRIDWSLTWPDQKFDQQGEQEGSIGAGKSLVLPLNFTAPLVTEKTDAVLKMTAKIGDKIYQDEKKFRVYPVVEESPKKMLVYDPEGETSATLKSLGYDLAPWVDQMEARDELLVIGRKALSDPSFPKQAFHDFVQQGGRAILFAQDPEYLRERAGLRVHRWIGRQFWPVGTQAEHPLLKGVDGIDLRDWSGFSSLLPNLNQHDLDEAAQRKGYPIYGYRVGGRGGVSSSAWEKPHHSGWTPLLEGEFDLAYSPLMYLPYGKGLLVSCSLDIEARLDPAASKITHRLIQWASQYTSLPRRETFYTGNIVGEQWLRMLTLKFQQTSSAPAAGSLWVIGPDAKIESSVVEAALAQNTQILIIGAQATLPMGLTTQTKAFGKISQPLPLWPELAGISMSELRCRTDIQVPLVQASEGVEIAADGWIARRKTGAGVLMAYQAHPELLEIEKKPYHRYSEWRWNRALSQLLTNLGGTFITDEQFFQFKANPYSSIDLAGTWKCWLEKSMPPSASPSEPSIDAVPVDRSIAQLGFDDSSWETFQAPAINQLGSTNLEKTDGSIWLRYRFNIPAEWEGKGDVTLTLGALDDFDQTFFNGIRVGAVDRTQPDSWNFPRIYRVRYYVVKPGQENVIAIRLFDQFGGGGMGAGGTPFSMRVELMDQPDNASYYVPGFLLDKEMGDDPARYTRW
ncbi:MAG: hypothetical protein EAZ42_10470 [Verrucomicrobia bacterium]|nr:MAG: hypothetical protein EAZ42_10470 [Verrucomicrobiota bacterium]